MDSVATSLWQEKPPHWKTASQCSPSTSMRGFCKCRVVFRNSGRSVSPSCSAFLQHSKYHRVGVFADSLHLIMQENQMLPAHGFYWRDGMGILMDNHSCLCMPDMSSSFGRLGCGICWEKATVIRVWHLFLGAASSMIKKTPPFLQAEKVLESGTQGIKGEVNEPPRSLL